MILCFYTAYLFRLPSVNSAKTIVNYSSRIRSAWGKVGLTLTEFDHSVLKDVLKGVKRLLPQEPDTKPAFILPNYLLPPIFYKPLSASQLKSAVTLGFLGMFRFSTYKKLGIHNLVIVADDGEEFRMSDRSFPDMRDFLQRGKAIGFYFQFPAKFHPVAHAFFCKLSNVSDFWARFCPLRVLCQLVNSGLLGNVIFSQSMVSSSSLSDYLRFMSYKRPPLGGSRFTPHSLRIGGHTFYSLKNMDSDFVHFLGRRAISKACQLYYRASAYDNIVRLRMFFCSIRDQHILEG